MPKAKLDTAGILDVMTRLHAEILGIEEYLGLTFGNGDMRPRIEFFHDAVRALTSGDAARLTVELLAYDVAALRYIQSTPLSPVQPGSARSPHNHPSVKTDRATKVRLGELYQQYAVLFAALFKPEADYNYNERTEALDNEVTRLAALLQTAARKSDLKAAIKKADAAIARLDKAHMAYGAGQLALFEDGKDVVKKLAGAGMNLAGKFLADAMAATGAGRGRQ